MGGSDQWGNIVAGIDLVRRTHQKKAFGITFPLITTSSGIKMGKTHKGAVWLDPERTSPYEYYQFWVNCDDADVARFMALFTFMPMEEIEAIKNMEGALLNKAKAILAWEATTIAHGKDQALSAYGASAAMFGVPQIPDDIIPSSTVPRNGMGGQENGGDASIGMAMEIKSPHDGVPGSTYDKVLMDKGLPAVDLFVEVGLCKSKSDARRLLSQGGGYLNDERIEAFDQLITTSDAGNGEILLRAGKKKYHKLILK
jgi:tyrosyl-tRNA synthetase